MIGEANQERLDSKLREKALELYRRLEGLPLPKFQGATVDFHQKRPAMVFIAEKELIAQVENGELLKFLVAQGVRRVLVDALWPSNVAILKQLIESGIEVWVLTRPSALHGWRKKHEGKPKGLVEWLERHHPQVLKGFKQGIKKDVFDAVLLRYVKPKFMRPLSKEHLTCWVSMLLYRYARRNRQGLLQQLDALPVSEDERSWRVEMSEDYLMMEAQSFVNTVRSNYPGIDKLFEELGISDDIVAQAYACEVFLEVDERRSPYRERNHFGLKWDDDAELLRDGAALYALNQLTAKVFGVNPRLARKGFRKKEWIILTRIHSFKRKLMGLRPGASAGETRARVLAQPLTAPAVRRRGVISSDITPARAPNDRGRPELMAEAIQTPPLFFLSRVMFDDLIYTGEPCEPCRNPSPQGPSLPSPSFSLSDLTLNLRSSYLLYPRDLLHASQPNHPPKVYVGLTWEGIRR